MMSPLYPARRMHQAWLAGLSALLLALFLAASAHAQEGTTIVVGDPSFEPMPIAVTEFAAPGDLRDEASTVRAIVESDLESSGLFRIIPRSAPLSQASDFNAVPSYADRRPIRAQALLPGQEQRGDGGRLVVQFRVFDVGGEQQTVGQQIAADPSDIRRIGPKVADGGYAPLP